MYICVYLYDFFLYFLVEKAKYSAKYVAKLQRSLKIKEIIWKKSFEL